MIKEIMNNRNFTNTKNNEMKHDFLINHYRAAECGSFALVLSLMSMIEIRYFLVKNIR